MRQFVRHTTPLPDGLRNSRATLAAVRWKYWIHHEWPEERTPWAEAFVRPDDPTYSGESLWVTIDCVETTPAAMTDSTDERSETLRRWLGDRPYRVADNGEAGDTDLVIQARDFSKCEFLGWVQVWLRSKGFTVTELVHAPLSDFAGTHPHADVLLRLTQRQPRDI
jgi:hypothetical protein